MKKTYCIKDNCYALLEYKPYIDEALSDVYEVVSYLFIEKNREEYYGDIFRGYAKLYKGNGEFYVAEIIAIEPVDSLDKLYTFIHEAGHIVNKHYSGNIHLKLKNKEKSKRMLMPKVSLVNEG